MFETMLDDVAQNSNFRHIHPGTKILLGLGSLIICLVSPTPVVPLISGIILSLVLLIPARVSPLVYGRLLLAPAIFTACSIIVLLFMLGGGDVIWRFSRFRGSISRSRTTLSGKPSSYFPGIGCTISLFFIALTTPMTDLFNVMKRCRIPIELIDLMMIMYRYIFIAYEQAREIWQAQIMRLGYSRVKESIRSFSMLCGMLFISSWNAGEGLIHAMDCRCYDGIMPSLDPAEPVQMQSLFPVLLYLPG